MKQALIFLFLSMACVCGQSQTRSYTDSMLQYQDAYVQKHEVVKGMDKKLMQFYPVSEAYNVKGTVALQPDSPWFLMETSGTAKQTYRLYGIFSFRLKDSLLQLHIYQSQSLLRMEQYKDHLFIPFTDATSGSETYISGRYLDVTLQDLEDGMLELDFNKAYNPYCAYVSGRYNCPIPPKENRLRVAIKAGEKHFAKIP